MTRPVRLGVGVVLAVTATVAIGVGSRFGFTAVHADRAELRLAWRARVPTVEECRRLTEVEQAELPVHMRRDMVCEGRVASYRLDVVVDGDRRHRSTVSGAGARGDRPLYVFESLPLEPGRHDIRVEFNRLGEDGEGERPTDGAERASELTIPDRLRWSGSVEVEGRDVVLVTYAAERRRLETR
jgi:hypothetical protein